MSEEITDKTNDELSTQAEEITEARNKPDLEQNTADILNENKRVTGPMSEKEAKKLMGKYSRRGFLVGGAAAVFGYLGYSWLREPEQQYLFTDALKFNENVSQLYYSPKHLAPEFKSGARHRCSP